MRNLARIFSLITLVLLLSAGVIFYFLIKEKQPVKFSFEFPTHQANSVFANNVDLKQPGNSAILAIPKHEYQTFNNCGPDTLSMVLSFYGIEVSQKELADKLRPYQHPRGDNDDKTLMASEYVGEAKERGFGALGRPNGTLSMVKLFIANGFPVVVKGWLKPNEDIGHYILIKGYDDNKKIFYLHDSYYGPKATKTYNEFFSIWQPFNYQYLIIYRPNQEELIKAIIGSEFDKKVAWSNALGRAKQDNALSPNNIYPLFNMSGAYYYLGDYKKSVEMFEKVADQLPRRMLWYQIEPILAYKELGDYSKVIAIADQLINGGNRAFSEMYLLKGQSYLSLSDKEAAKENFEKALFYNKNYKAAQEALRNF